MGLYDREYYREERSGMFLGGDRTMVTNLIIVNVVIYIVDLLLDGALQNHLEVHADLFRHPWDAWQLLTAGFVHSRNAWHVLINMVVLFFFGRDVETIYGRMEFLRIYLCLIVLSSLAWVLSEMAIDELNATMLGASGGVMGIMMLFVLHFPKRLIYIWGVLPVPAWALGAVYVAQDVLGLGAGRDPRGGEQVANATHLAGALFAYLYWQFSLNLGRLVPSRLRWPSLRGRPQLRVHDPRSDAPESLDKRVDQVLEKVNREGIDSLSDEERKLLEDASRRYQRRRS